MAYEAFARCMVCGDLEHDGTAADADKVAEKHTKATQHATGSGIQLVVR